MASTEIPSLQVGKPLPSQRKFLETLRKDLWWVQPAITLFVFSSFIVYATFGVLHPTNYWYGNYLSPMFSPEIFGDSPHALFGPKPDWWPSWMFFSPAMLVLWAPAGFRFTCYYYRGAYYKAFWGDPPGCAVGESRKSYWGENSFPLVYQNIHRYFMYFAVVLVFFLSHDAWKALHFNDNGHEVFGLGVGTIVLSLNALFLGMYTFGCHSIRHLVGGYLDQMTKRPGQKKAWDCVTCLNKYHPVHAWVSLLWVMFTDLYIRMVATGTWTDWRIF